MSLETPRFIAVLFTLLAVLGAACSGSDDVADGASEAADTDLDAVVQADPTDESDAADEAEAGDTGGDSAGATIDASQCTEIAEALSSVPAALSTAATGQADLSALQDQAEAFSEVADQVPAEVADDFQVVADVFAEIASTLDGVSLEPGQVPDQATIDALTELSTTLSDPAYSAASTNVAAFFAGGCQ